MNFATLDSFMNLLSDKWISCYLRLGWSEKYNKIVESVILSNFVKYSSNYVGS